MMTADGVTCIKKGEGTRYMCFSEDKAIGVQAMVGDTEFHHVWDNL